MKVLVISFIMAIGLSACKSGRSSQKVNPTNTATPTDTVIAPSGGIPSPTETATPSVECKLLNKLPFFKGSGIYPENIQGDVSMI